jgi:hypothetical protein
LADGEGMASFDHPNGQYASFLPEGYGCEVATKWGTDPSYVPDSATESTVNYFYTNDGTVGVAEDPVTCLANCKLGVIKHWDEMALNDLVCCMFVGPGDGILNTD